MASPTGRTWVWASSGSWWRTGKPGVLQSMGSQRVRHDWVTEQPQQNSVIPLGTSLVLNMAFEALHGLALIKFLAIPQWVHPQTSAIINLITLTTWVHLYMLFSVPESPFSLSSSGYLELTLQEWAATSKSSRLPASPTGPGYMRKREHPEIPWTEEPGGLRSMGSQRVGQDWACTQAHTRKERTAVSLLSPEFSADLPSLHLSVFLWFLNIYDLKILAMLSKRNREEYISILFQNRNHSINICQVEAKTWIQPKCPLTKEWIKKMWYMYTMECYSAIRKVK